MSHELNLRELELFGRPVSKDGSSTIGHPSIIRKESSDAVDFSQETLAKEAEDAHVQCPQCGGKGLIDPDLTRVRSSTSSKLVPVPGPPPDGGWRAWTQAVVGHIVIFNTWGYINSYGVFQTYYVATLNHPPSDISWVGSVQVWLLFFIGTFSGRATDAGYFRVTIIAGSVFMVLGAFMTSLSTQYWQLFLAQGICTGIGNGLLFCPSLALLSTYFTKRRAVAIAIAASGSATGGMVYPAMVESLLPRIGFGWTLRVVGFIMLALQLVVLAFAKQRLPPRKTGPLVEWAAFKELPYLFFSIGMFLIFWGLYFGFYYVGAFATDIIGLSRPASINLLIMMNGVGLVGRMVPAYLADRYFGPLNTIIPFALISGVMIYAWASVHTAGSLYAFAAIYGLFAAGIQSLFPATLSSLTTDMSKMGVRMGMVFTIVSFATLTGTPLAGALIQHENGSYLAAQLFAGSVLVGGCMTLVAARLSRTGLVFKSRM